MQIIASKTLRQFWEKHPNFEQTLKAWAHEVRSAQWQQPSDIKQMYRSASVLKNRRAIFNIKGGSYRLIVAIAFKYGIVYIKFIGTHDDYNKVNAETVEPE